MSLAGHRDRKGQSADRKCWRKASAAGLRTSGLRWLRSARFWPSTATTLAHPKSSEPPGSFLSARASQSTNWRCKSERLSECSRPPLTTVDLSPHAATRAKDDVKQRSSEPLTEFESRFRTGLGRSVNRKVQGSNPCTGAKSEYELTTRRRAAAPRYISSTSIGY